MKHSFEGNNDKAAETTTNVRAPPLRRADLIVESVAAPTDGTAGQPLRVTYTVTNTASTATRQNSWQDAIYLSLDQTLNTQTDTLLGRRTRIGALAGGASESRTYDLALPNNALGNYYIIVATDSSDSVLEVDDTNNVGVAWQCNRRSSESARLTRGHRFA